MKEKPFLRGSYSARTKVKTEQDLTTAQPRKPEPILPLLSRTLSPVFLHQRLHVNTSQAEIEAAELVAENRPTPLREYDQIAMRTYDLLRQTKLIASYLADKKVVFVGDNDCASLMLCMLMLQGNPGPAHIQVLDFDERLLAAIEAFALQYGFSHLVDVRRYNVFDAPPADLIGQADWFYCNPPFGAYNEGASARLFIARGQELCGQKDVSGCILLPYDPNRHWTTGAWLATERYLVKSGWCVRAKVDYVHQYYLDDDPELTSSVIIVDAVKQPVRGQVLPYAGRRVLFREISRFYGRSIAPPYPRYVRLDGSFDTTWNDSESEQS